MNTATDLVTVHEEVGPNIFLVEISNEPGVLWQVTVVRDTPLLAVWKRLCTTIGKNKPNAKK